MIEITIETTEVRDIMITTIEIEIEIITTIGITDLPETDGVVGVESGKTITKRLEF